MGAKAERTRQQLIEAAEIVFGERGYTAATVDEIAEKAGMSIGALYSRIGGKEDVFVAVFEHYLDQRRAELDVLSSRGPIDPNSAAAEWLDLVDSRAPQLLLFLEFWLYAARKSAPSARRMAQSLRDFDMAIEAALASSLARGADSDAASATARSIIAMYRGAALARTVGAASNDAARLAKSTSDLLAAITGTTRPNLNRDP